MILNDLIFRKPDEVDELEPGQEQVGVPSLGDGSSCKHRGSLPQGE